MSEKPGWSKGTYAQGNTVGGALLDLHIHDTDFVQSLFGRPASVFSTGVMGAGDWVEHVVTQYNYEGGPAVYAEGSWLLTKGFSMSYTVLCEHATLDFELSRGADALQVTEEGQAPRAVKFDEPDGYATEIAYLLAAIQSGQAPTVVTAADGLTAIEICEAEERSIKTGQVVKL